MYDNDDSRSSDTPDVLAEVLRKRREAVGEPKYEQLQAYARGKLSPDEARRIEDALVLYPELKGLVDAMAQPDPRIYAAVDRALHQARADQRRQRWKAWVLPGGSLVGAALALLLLWKPTGSVEFVDGGIRLPASTRASSSLQQYAQGQSQEVSLAFPDTCRWGALIEVDGRAVDVVAVLEAGPGEQVNRTLKMNGDDTVSFLVVAFAPDPISEVSLVEALRKEASSGPLLSAEDEATRARRIESALAGSGHPLQISISTLFQVMP